VTQNKKLTDKN